MAGAAAGADDNDLADTDFNLYSDGNEIYLTYQEATEQLTKETAALKELTKHTGLRTAKYDAETEKFTSAEEVTEKNSDVYAFRPKTGIRRRTGSNCLGRKHRQ